MTKKTAKILWEDILLNGTKGTAIKTLKITTKEAKVFMSYTMPEMFVDKEINRINSLRIKELKEKEKQVRAVLEEKQSSKIILNIGLFFYITIIFPILAFTIYIKYIY